MSERILDRFRIEQAMMPASDSVFEVSATPFEAVSITMLFSESILRLNASRALYESGCVPPQVSIESVETFFERYADPLDHAAGLDACKRLATHRPLLTFGELCCIAVICQVGISLMENSDDWADHVGGWLGRVREQVLDDYKVRCEA